MQNRSSQGFNPKQEKTQVLDRATSSHASSFFGPGAPINWDSVRAALPHSPPSEGADRSDCSDKDALLASSSIASQFASRDDPIVTARSRWFPAGGLAINPRAPTPQLPMAPARYRVPFNVRTSNAMGNATASIPFRQPDVPSIKAPVAPPQAADENAGLNSDTASTMNSLVSLLQLRPNAPATTDFAVLKIRNISWDLKYVPLGHVAPHYTQGVHVVMNRTTGKTQSECFIEFPTYMEAERALDLHERGVLKGRVVVVQWSTQAELMSSLFPNWIGATREDSSSQLAGNSVPLMDEAAAPQQQQPFGNGVVYGPTTSGPAKEGVFLLREEINAMLLICRNYKVCFSRKCPERPFENVISILCKIPWHKPQLVGLIQRDHVFEMLKLSIESLRIHLSRDHNNISGTLLERMIRAGLCVPLFTERQKLTLLAVAVSAFTEATSFDPFTNPLPGQGMDCPQDLAPFVYNPPGSEETGTSVADADPGEQRTECASGKQGTSAPPTPTALASEVPADGNMVQRLRMEEQVPFSAPALELLTGTSFISIDRQDAPCTPRDARRPPGAPRAMRSESGNVKEIYPSPDDDRAFDSQGRPLPESPTPGPAQPFPRFGAPETPPSPDNSGFLLHRIRLLESALRHSETQHAELRRTHERATAQAAAEVAELRDGKIRAERRAHEGEIIIRHLERENNSFKLRLQGLSSASWTSPILPQAQARLPLTDSPWSAPVRDPTDAPTYPWK
ncbi:hypothetical protein HK104_001973 [Borealophlyctis nickersoniae]|nr:hypothetical protein HK104_001973 [Borealophlyctis nickersoniae]